MKVLDLGRPGVHGGARASIALLPTSEARGLESRSPFGGGEGRLRSRDLIGLSEVRFQILPQIRTRLFFLSTALQCDSAKVLSDVVKVQPPAS